MTHDFNRPPHVTSTEEVTQKKRLPVYILAIVGVFLLALVLYMLAVQSRMHVKCLPILQIQP